MVALASLDYPNIAMAFWIAFRFTEEKRYASVTGPKNRGDRSDKVS